MHDSEKSPGNGNSAMEVTDQGKVDLVINIPREYNDQGRPDGYLIRRRAVDAGVPLITESAARAGSHRGVAPKASQSE